MSYDALTSKELLESLFTALAKEYRRLAKKKAIPIEITVIEGASILLNYGFRESTYDVDAMIPDAQVLKDAIKNVGLNFNLEPKWLNTDFERSSSYSKHLLEHAEFYKDYLGLIEVRCIIGEYLIAMKLKASREYKYDISDVIGILNECKKRKSPIDKLMISQAVIDLYGSLDKIQPEVWERLDSILANGDFESLVQEYRKAEMIAMNAKVGQKQKAIPPKEDNTEAILALLKKNGTK